MRIIALIIIMLLPLLHSAQQIQFSRTYPIGNGSDYTAASVQKPDSGFVFVSNVLQPGFVGFAYTATDKFGDTLFTRSYPFADRAFSFGIQHSLVITSDGNYVQCGSSIDTMNNRNGCIVKFDVNGDTMWMKNYGSPVWDVHSSVYEDDSARLWVCGNTKNNTNGQADFWLLILDQNGNIRLDTTYGTFLEEVAVCGDFTNDGGFVISGLRGGVPYVVKLKADYSVEWTQTFNSLIEYAYIKQLPDSGYVMACGIDAGSYNAGALVRLDSAGAVTDTDTLGPVNWRTIFYTKPILINSGIVLGGITSPPNGNFQGYWTKTDYSGNMIWQRDYVLQSFTQQYLYDLQPTSDGGFVIAGSWSMAQQDSWLVKTDSLGCPVPACDGVPVQDEHNAYDILFFPNPSNGILNVSGILPAGSELMIFNQLGQLVVPPVQLSTSGSTNITTDLAGGIYFCRIVANGELIKDETIAITE